MEIKKYSGWKGTENAEDLKKPWNIQDTDAVRQIGKETLESLKKAIAELEGLVSGRQKLCEGIISEAEKIKMDITNFINEKEALDPASLKDQIMLKQKQVEVSELQLREKIDCWQDIMRLKKELREHKRELEDKQGRMSMLDEILK